MLKVLILTICACACTSGVDTYDATTNDAAHDAAAGGTDADGYAACFDDPAHPLACPMEACGIRDLGQLPCPCDGGIGGARACQQQGDGGYWWGVCRCQRDE